MRRLTPGLRAWLIARSSKEQRQRQRRRGKGGRYGEGVSDRNAKFPWLPPRPHFVDPREVRLVGDIDLIHKPDETLAQLTSLDRIESMGLPQRVMLDLKQVRSIDSAALLFLCSRIAKLGNRPHVEVSGNYPPNDSAGLRTLRDAEFDSFLNGAPPIHFRGGAKTLSLIDGTGAGSRLVTGGIATRINEFLKGRHPGLSTEELDALSLAVTECLENVRVHAYGDAKPERRKGWYVVGRYDESSLTSSVAILDMGVGIAKTVEVRFAFGGRFKTTLDMVEAATAGRVTASGAKNRGKGYGFLRRFVQREQGRRLTVMSSSAMVTWGKGGILEKRSTAAFTGTIVCLQITNT